MAHLVFDTPLGCMGLSAWDGAVTQLYLPGGAMPPSDRTGGGVLELAKNQLLEYLAGTRQRFSLPLRPAGTAFQQRVWAALLRISYGQTQTYSDLAAMVGNPKAARAVGAANHKNPIAILIPCHRVVGKDGSLTGYAGGLELKQKLLNLEGVRLL